MDVGPAVSCSHVVLVVATLPPAPVGPATHVGLVVPTRVILFSLQAEFSLCEEEKNFHISSMMSSDGPVADCRDKLNSTTKRSLSSLRLSFQGGKSHFEKLTRDFDAILELLFCLLSRCLHQMDQRRNDEHVQVGVLSDQEVMKEAVIPSVCPNLSLQPMGAGSEQDLPEVYGASGAGLLRYCFCGSFATL